MIFVVLKTLFSKRKNFFSYDWGHWDVDPPGAVTLVAGATRDAIPPRERIGRVMRWRVGDFVLLKQAVPL
jgi:hypothetical protein